MHEEPFFSALPDDIETNLEVRIDALLQHDLHSL